MTDKTEKTYRYSPLVTSRTKQITTRIPLELISKIELITDKRSKFVVEALEFAVAVNTAKITKSLPFKPKSGVLGLTQTISYGIFKELDRQGKTDGEISDILNSYGLRTHLLEAWDAVTVYQFRKLYLS